MKDASLDDDDDEPFGRNDYWHIERGSHGTTQFSKFSRIQPLAKKTCLVAKEEIEKKSIQLESMLIDFVRCGKGGLDFYNRVVAVEFPYAFEKSDALEEDELGLPLSALGLTSKRPLEKDSVLVQQNRLELAARWDAALVLPPLWKKLASAPPDRSARLRRLEMARALHDLSRDTLALKESLMNVCKAALVKHLRRFVVSCYVQERLESTNALFSALRVTIWLALLRLDNVDRIMDTKSSKTAPSQPPPPPPPKKGLASFGKQTKAAASKGSHDSRTVSFFLKGLPFEASDFLPPGTPNAVIDRMSTETLYGTMHALIAVWRSLPPCKQIQDLARALFHRYSDLCCWAVKDPDRLVFDRPGSGCCCSLATNQHGSNAAEYVKADPAFLSDLERLFYATESSIAASDLVSRRFQPRAVSSPVFQLALASERRVRNAVIRWAAEYASCSFRGDLVMERFHSRVFHVLVRPGEYEAFIASNPFKQLNPHQALYSGRPFDMKSYETRFLGQRPHRLLMSNEWNTESCQAFFLNNVFLIHDDQRDGPKKNTANKDDQDEPISFDPKGDDKPFLPYGIRSTNHHHQGTQWPSYGRCIKPMKKDFPHPGQKNTTTTTTTTTTTGGGGLVLSSYGKNQAKLLRLKPNKPPSWSKVLDGESACKDEIVLIAFCFYLQENGCPVQYESEFILRPEGNRTGSHRMKNTTHENRFGQATGVETLRQWRRQRAQMVTDCLTSRELPPGDPFEFDPSEDQSGADVFILSDLFPISTDRYQGRLPLLVRVMGFYHVITLEPKPCATAALPLTSALVEWIHLSDQILYQDAQASSSPLARLTQTFSETVKTFLKKEDAPTVLDDEPLLSPPLTTTVYKEGACSSFQAFQSSDVVCKSPPPVESKKPDETPFCVFMSDSDVPWFGQASSSKRSALFSDFLPKG